MPEVSDVVRIERKTQAGDHAASRRTPFHRSVGSSHKTFPDLNVLLPLLTFRPRQIHNILNLTKPQTASVQQSQILEDTKNSLKTKFGYAGNKWHANYCSAHMERFRVCSYSQPCHSAPVLTTHNSHASTRFRLSTCVESCIQTFSLTSRKYSLSSAALVFHRRRHPVRPLCIWDRTHASVNPFFRNSRREGCASTFFVRCNSSTLPVPCRYHPLREDDYFASLGEFHEQEMPFELSR